MLSNVLHSVNNPQTFYSFPLQRTVHPAYSYFQQCLEDAWLQNSAPGCLNFLCVIIQHVRLLSPQEQFEFALTAVAEEVNAILKALPQ